MSTKINVRSPFSKQVNNANLESATLSLYIYEGELTTDKPVSAQYTITKTPLGSNTYVNFEISELVRDYLEITFNGTYTSQVVWVEADVDLTLTSGSTTDNSDYLAFDGYGYFEEGINPLSTNGLLISNDTFVYNEGENIILPISAEVVGRISFGSEAGDEWEIVDTNWESYNEDWGGLQPDITITDNGNTNQKIQYVTISSSELFTDQDTILIYNKSDVLIRTLRLDETCEPKYTPYKITFVNKYGALQDLWMFKKTTESISVQTQSYKANIFNASGLTYSVNQHQNATLNKIGKEKLIMNTGFVDDTYQSVIRELMLSEQVWIYKDGQALPINPTDQQATYKTSINDKVINYTINFDYAFDKINNIR